VNRFHRHIPNFCDDRGMDRTPFEFETKEQLFASEHVVGFSKSMPGRQFVGFRMDGRTLIAVYEDGFHWWVVGHVEQPMHDVPEWEGWKFRVMTKDRKVSVMGRDQVVASQGDVLTLANGEKALKVTDRMPTDLDAAFARIHDSQEVWFVKDQVGNWVEPPRRTVFPVFGTRGW